MRSVNERSQADRGLRVGVGLGVQSGGLRLYGQDADEDGRTEAGVGVSLPAFGVGLNVDYTTETPIGDLVSLASPVSFPVQIAMQTLGAERHTPAVQIQQAAERLWAPGSHEPQAPALPNPMPATGQEEP